MLRFTDIDNGYDELKKRFAEAKDRRVTVGVHAQDSIDTANAGRSARHDGRDHGGRFVKKNTTVAGDGGGTGRSNAEIGSAHEYGTDVLPERSFLRATLDKHGAEYVSLCKQLSSQIIDGKIGVDRALGLLGERVKADVVQMFNNNEIQPDISQATKDRKGSSTVLIDTGSLKQSIDYLVRALGQEIESAVSR